MRENLTCEVAETRRLEAYETTMPGSETAIEHGDTLRFDASEAPLG
jgi:hypothetical protein